MRILKVPRSVGSTVLDENASSVQLQKSLKILKPISSAITTSESDSALLSDIPYQMGQSKSMVLENLSAVSLASTEKSKGNDFIKKLEKFANQIIYATWSGSRVRPGVYLYTVYTGVYLYTGIPVPGLGAPTDNCPLPGTVQNITMCLSSFIFIFYYLNFFIPHPLNSVRLYLGK